MDNKHISQDFIDDLDKDMQTHPLNERNQLMDWLMANQLMKDKKTIALIESWEYSLSNLQRRTFWYYQARLRWTGQTRLLMLTGLNIRESYEKLLHGNFKFL